MRDDPTKSPLEERTRQLEQENARLREQLLERRNGTNYSSKSGRVEQVDDKENGVAAVGGRRNHSFGDIYRALTVAIGRAVDGLLP